MVARILLADPDSTLVECYSQYLSQLEFEVITAADGLACLDRLRDGQPDVLILEADVPWGGGEGVLARMHEGADVPIVPVLLLASQLDNRVLSLVATYPTAECQVKPLAPPDLVHEIRQVLTRTPVSQLARASP